LEKRGRTTKIRVATNQGSLGP